MASATPDAPFEFSAILLLAAALRLAFFGEFYLYSADYSVLVEKGSSRFRAKSSHELFAPWSAPKYSDHRIPHHRFIRYIQSRVLRWLSKHLDAWSVTRMPFLCFKRKQKSSAGLQNEDPNLRFIVISADEDFYIRLREIASSCNWQIGRATSVDEVELLVKAKPTPIVVYERNAEDGNWRDKVRRIGSLPSQPCVFLGSQVADDYLLQEVVRNQGYDVLAKSAPDEKLIKCLRFAWFWSQTKDKSQISSPGRRA